MFTFAVDFVEDFFGYFGPDKWVCAGVPAVDEGADGGGEIADGSEGAASGGLAFNDAEPDFDHVQPGHRGRCEVGVEPRVGL